MTKPLTLILAVFLFVSACQTDKKENRSPLDLTGQINSIFDTIPNFSGVILLAEKGKPVFHKAFGVRSFETNVPLDTSDIFELASVSKQFTAMAIMMLKEEGKLDYSDPLEKFVPGLPYTGITVRHLLTHTSGLPDYQEMMDKQWDKSKVATNTDIIAYLKKFSPPKNFEPGEKYEYSNTGYVLLGSIVEAASENDFVEFCRERIFRPLEMTSTDIRTNDDKLKLPNLAYGHVYVPEKSRYVRADSFPSSNYTIWLGGRKGPGRISSTTADLLKWDQALYTEKLVKWETLKEAFKSTPLNDGTLSHYGFGWIITPDSPLGKVVWHTGDNPGYSTIIIRYVDIKKTLIILNNNYHSQFENIRTAIEGLLAEKDMEVEKAG